MVRVVILWLSGEDLLHEAWLSYTKSYKMKGRPSEGCNVLRLFCVVCYSLHPMALSIVKNLVPGTF